jgi:hypothetical protein
MSLSFEKTFKLLIPNSNLLRKMLGEERRLVRKDKIWSERKNEIHKKFAVQKGPWESAAKKHLKHKQLNFYLLVLAYLRGIHIG